MATPTEVRSLSAAASFAVTDFLLGQASGRTLKVTPDVLPFLQAGTGAQEETLQTAVRRVIFSGQYGTLQQALNVAAGNILYIEGANAITASLTPSSDTTIEFLPGATITVASGQFATGDAIFKINEKDNVKINGHGATITGTREGTGTNLIWMGVRITGSTNIRVQDLDCANMAGDGFYIAQADDNDPWYSENVWIIRCRANNCMRNGLALVSCVNFWCTDSIFSNTNGKSPQFGVDIEPDGTNEKLVNCHFINCGATMNAGVQFGSHIGGNASPISNAISVYLESCTAYDSTTSGMIGFDISGHKSSMANDGVFEINNCVAVNIDSYGCAVRNIDKDGQPVTFNNLQLLNTNTGQRTTYGGDAPLTIFSTNATGLEDPGGVHIYGLRVVDKTADRTPYFINASSTSWTDIIIKGLDWENSVGKTSFPYMDDTTTNTYVEFVPEPYRVNRTSGITLSTRYSGFVLSNNGAAILVTYTLPAVAVGLRFKFEVMDADGVRIDPNASDRLWPFGTGDGTYIESTTIGSTALVYANQTGTDWVVERQGTWVDE